MTFSCCGLIPVYNHPDAVGDIVAAVLAHGLPVILVDDGSEPHCAQVLDELAESSPTVHLKRLPRNRGKGGAVKAGLRFARELGFSHALQVDADGQHDTTAIPQLLQFARRHPGAIISGRPRYDDSVPALRYYSRYLTHVWVWINTLSTDIADSMCGFRVYPVDHSCGLLDSQPVGDRMDFDTEILVRWHWGGGEVLQLPVAVLYPVDGISHFRALQDNWLITRMHARLFFGMLLRLPVLLRRRLRRAGSTATRGGTGL